MTALPTCCKPVQRWSPSGLAWVHARSCPVDPKQKIRNVAETTPREEVNAVLEEAVEDEVVRRTEARARTLAPVRPLVHPACMAAYSDGARPCSRCAPVLHRADCDCIDCEYFMAHADDD